MYQIVYYADHAKVDVLKDLRVINQERYLYPDDMWYDFFCDGINYSLQVLVEDGKVWAGLWNIDIVGENTTPDNNLKASFQIIQIDSSKSL